MCQQRAQQCARSVTQSMSLRHAGARLPAGVLAGQLGEGGGEAVGEWCGGVVGVKGSGRQAGRGGREMW